jgi:predicted RNA-binding protein YlxR (DUF448 family)
MKHQPLRMCIACRKLKPKQELIKIVKNKNNLIEVDFLGKLTGRGAYICKEEACYKKCNKQKLLNKVFSMFVPDDVYEQLENAYEKLK